MAILEVNTAQFETEVLKSEKPVLVDFYATWCGPCRMLRPSLEELSEEKPGVKFVSVDVDENEELAARYGISSIPCVILFQNGEVAEVSVGLRPKDYFEELLGE